MQKILLFLTLLTACAEASALPTSIYMSDGTTLYQLNPSTAAQIGSHTLSISGLTGMAFSSGGTLYGSFFIGLNYNIGTIDTSNGNVTLLPQIATPGGAALAFSGLSLYEAATTSDIYGVDANTGAVGTPYFCGAFGRGLAIGGDGKAWMGGINDQVYEYTLAAGGACTGSGGGGSPTGSGATSSFRALSYSNGAMYALDTISSQLDTFDGNTFPGGGIVSPTTIGSVSSSFNSLAVYTTTSSVPEPTVLSVVGTGLIGLAGLLYRRRRTR